VSFELRKATLLGDLWRVHAEVCQSWVTLRGFSGCGGGYARGAAYRPNCGLKLHQIRTDELMLDSPINLTILFAALGAAVSQSFAARSLRRMAGAASTLSGLRLDLPLIRT
jgi:hypothetical protein